MRSRSAAKRERRGSLAVCLRVNSGVAGYAEGDDISASAPQLVGAMTCEKTYVHFTAAEGAGDHCQQGARALYHARSFAWLDDLLHPTRGADQSEQPPAG